VFNERTIVESFEWQQISRTTYRAKVPGGWIIKDLEERVTKTPEFWATAVRKSVGNALCFIEDEKYEWEVADW